MEEIETAIDALRRGDPIMIYDDDKREAEVDLVYHASKVTYREVHELRVNAGGLICFVIDSRTREALNIPWGDELISMAGHLSPLSSKKLSYGDKPAFTIWVNYAGVRTGISDEDRALTISKLYTIVRMVHEGRVEEARELFLQWFQAPGHVPILASRGLSRRRGHTELSIAMAILAGLTPAMVISEMLGERHSLSIAEAMVISKKRNIPLVRGSSIVEACMKDEVCRGS